MAVLVAGMATASDLETILCPMSGYFKYLDEGKPWDVVFKDPGWSGYPPSKEPSTAVFSLTAADKLTKFTGYVCGWGGEGIKPFADQLGYPIRSLFLPVYCPKGINDKRGEMSYTKGNTIWGYVIHGIDWLGYERFEQIDPDWSSEHLGFSKVTTIGMAGCCLTSVANATWRLGLGMNPLQLNNALKAYTNSKGHHTGFLGVVNVNHEAVCAIAQSYGLDLRFKRLVPGDKSIKMGCATICTVKNGGHLVLVPGFRSDGQHTMIDSMGRSEILEDYWGVNLNNTRCYYTGNGNTPVGAYNGEIIWICSSLVASAEDNSVSIVLEKGNEVLARGEVQELEDSTTGEVESSGVVLEYTGKEEESGVPYGNYSLKATGPAGAKIQLLEYFKGYEERETELFIGASGTLSYDFTHEVFGYLSDVGGIADLEIGTPIEIGAGIVTAKVPEGFYLQAEYSRTPAVFVKWDGDVSPGHPLQRLTGRVAKENSQRYVEATGVELSSNTKRAKPLGVAPEKASTTFHLYLRTAGQVTNGAFNGCLPIQGMTVSDGWHAIQGVYHQGTLYCDIVE